MDISLDSMCITKRNTSLYAQTSMKKPLKLNKHDSCCLILLVQKWKLFTRKLSCIIIKVRGPLANVSIFSQPASLNIIVSCGSCLLATTTKILVMNNQFLFAFATKKVHFSTLERGCICQVYC